MARPSKFSQDIADKILSALRAGNTLKASAAYVGVSENTLARWRVRYGGFGDQISRAEAEAEVRYVAVIAKAANDGDWRASLAWLERRRRDDWREHKSMELTGKDGAPLGDSLTDEERARRVIAIVQRARERAAGSADGTEADLDAATGATD